MIAIQPIGEFLPQDANGWIINDLSMDKIANHWQVVIEKVVNLYHEEYKHHLHSIYVRGSVARGMAVDGISDLDTFALVNHPTFLRWQNADNQVEVAGKLAAQFDFVNGVEMNIASYHTDFYNKNPRLAMILKTQSLCVFGENIAPELPRFRANKEMCLNTKWLKEDVEAFLKKIKIQSNTLEDCRTMMKVWIRVGFEVVMEREKRFTSDLYLCYRTFSKYYPQHEKAMKQALIWYLNPITDGEQLTEYFSGFGHFLINQTTNNAY